MTAKTVLAELSARGVVLVAVRNRLRFRPRRAVSAELRSELREHAAEILQLMTERGAHRKNEPSIESEAPPWIVSSAGDGDMRLVVATGPPWPNSVYEAAALVEVLDDRHRTNRAGAQQIAERLERALEALRAVGVDAWLAS